MEKKQSIATNTKLSWIRGKCIGKGSFGTVNLAHNKSNGSVFAVKSVDFSSSQPNQIEALENEITILRSLNFPHIVQYLNDDVSYESSIHYRNLHMEYFPGGTIADVATEMDESTVQSYTYCIVSALNYLHSRNIVHCDVKGKNILITESGQAKLADLGSSVEIRRGGEMKPRGSPLWMAPEVVRQESQGPESDVWSLGCTIIEMITGKPAWEDKGIPTLVRIGCSGSIPEIPSRISEVGRDFLTKCLKFDATQRWSCDQLLHHPFISSFATNTGSELSPRCVLDWFNYHDECSDVEMELSDDQEGARDRIGKLGTNGGVNWESDGWVLVRGSDKEEGRSWVNSDETVEMEGRNWVYLDTVGVELRRDLEFKNFGGSEATLREECLGKLGGCGEISYSGVCNLLNLFWILRILWRSSLFCLLMRLLFVGLKISIFIHMKPKPIETKSAFRADGGSSDREGTNGETEAPFNNLISVEAPQRGRF